jgi:hypothetical protein
MPVKRKLGEAAAPRVVRVKSLTIRDFLALVDDGLRERLGPEYATFEMRQRFGYVQYWLGEPFAEGGRRATQSGWMHYEIWVQRKTQRLEIGLHFEGDRERSYTAAALLADNIPAVIDAIGPEYELEEWTPSWTRLHRSFAAPSLTSDLAAEAAEHASQLITGMEPLIATLKLRAGD